MYRHSNLRDKSFASKAWPVFTRDKWATQKTYVVCTCIAIFERHQDLKIDKTDFIAMSQTFESLSFVIYLDEFSVVRPRLKTIRLFCSNSFYLKTLSERTNPVRVYVNLVTSTLYRERFCGATIRSQINCTKATPTMTNEFQKQILRGKNRLHRTGESKYHRQTISPRCQNVYKKQMYTVGLSVIRQTLRITRMSKKRRTSGECIFGKKIKTKCIYIA